MDALLLKDLVAEDWRDPGLVLVLLVVESELDNLRRSSGNIAGSPLVIGGIPLHTRTGAEGNDEGKLVFLPGLKVCVLEYK